MPSFTATHANGQTSYCEIDNFTDPWAAPPPTLLIQHGFARTSQFWYHWIPSLSRNFRIIRRDIRGHGRPSFPSPDSPYPYTVSTILSEILETLDQAGVTRAHLLGESTSGIVSMLFAAAHPSRVASLTLCASPTHLPPAAQELFAFGYEDWPGACRALGSRGWAQALAAVGGTVAGEDPAYLSWWLDEVAKSQAEGLAGYAEFLGALDARPVLAGIRTPTLILAPTRSAAVPLEASRWLKGQIEGARLVEVDGKGHEIYAECAELCQQEVLKFLKEVEG